MPVQTRSSTRAAAAAAPAAAIAPPPLVPVSLAELEREVAASRSGVWVWIGGDAVYLESCVPGHEVYLPVTPFSVPLSVMTDVCVRIRAQLDGELLAGNAHARIQPGSGRAWHMQVAGRWWLHFVADYATPASLRLFSCARRSA